MGHPGPVGWGTGGFEYESSVQPREKLVSRDGGRLQLILNRLHDDAINMDCGSESVYVGQKPWVWGFCLVCLTRGDLGGCYVLLVGAVCYA